MIIHLEIDGKVIKYRAGGILHINAHLVSLNHSITGMKTHILFIGLPFIGHDGNTPVLIQGGNNFLEEKYRRE